MTISQVTKLQSSGKNGLIKSRQIDLVYTHADISMAAFLIAALIFVLVFRAVAPLSMLVGWLVVYVLVTAFQYFLRRSYLATPDRDHLDGWYIAFVVTSAMLGLLWGMTGLVFVPEAADAATALIYTTVAALFACVLAAAAAFAFVARISACMAFIAPCLLPMGVSFTLFGYDLQRLVGLIVVLVFIFLALLSLRANKSMLEWMRASVEQDKQLRQLGQKYLNIMNTNDELRVEISRHRAVEEELRRQKGKADSLADQLKALSSRDGLTGIANRRYLDSILEREWQRALRNNSPLSLVICDIDYFKNYNDVYGHHKGDQCLIKVARTLNSFCRRGGDLCARYGGEEFAIVLPDTDNVSALELAESIRAAVHDLKIPHCASDAGTRVTLSLGVVSMIPDSSASTTQLIEMADSALYKAKAAGRNRVINAVAEIKPTEAGFMSVRVNAWNELTDGELTVDAVLRKFEELGFRCNLQHYEPDITMGTHASMRDEIHAVIKGKLVITVNGQEYQLNAGDYIQLPRGTTRRVRAGGDAMVQVIIAIRMDASSPRKTI